MASMFHRMSGAAALALALLAAAGPAAAGKRAIVPLPRAGVVADEESRIYCTNVRSRGASFNHQECRTRAQWAAKGVTVAGPAAASQLAASKPE